MSDQEKQEKTEGTSHWDELASELGAAATPAARHEPSSASPRPSESGRRDAIRRPAIAKADSAAADWDILASELGMPPGPPPSEPVERHAQTRDETRAHRHAGRFAEEPTEADAAIPDTVPAAEMGEPAPASHRRGDRHEGRKRRRRGRRSTPDASGQHRAQREAGRRPAEDSERPIRSQSDHGEDEDVDFLSDAIDIVDQPPQDAETRTDADTGRRRRRRRRGGRRRERDHAEGGASESSGDLHDAKAIAETGPDEHQTSSSAAGDEFADTDDAENDGEEGRAAGHRGVPSWEDALSTMIGVNMEARAKNPNRGTGGPRRGRGRRGRGRPSKN